MILLTIRQFAEKHPWPSAPAIRALIHNKEIEGAIIRSGRRILIDEEKFFEEIKKNHDER